MISQTVADKIEIRDMLHRYCRGLDRMDRALALSVFHPDSQLDYGPVFKGSGAAFIDWVWPNHEKAIRHSHNVTNCYIEVDGERAASEAYSYMLMLVETPHGAMVLRNNGRYLDEWVRYQGGWVIMKRQSVHEFFERRLLEDGTASSGPCAATRDTMDPSYQLEPPLFKVGAA
jgi:hypothetical protein